MIQAFGKLIKNGLKSFTRFNRTGSYDIAEAEGVARGTKIIVHLKNDCRRFSLKTEVEGTLNIYITCII